MFFSSFIMVIFLVVVIAIAIFMIPYRFRKMVKIILAILVFAFVVTVCVYMLNPSFRLLINMHIDRTSQHVFLRGLNNNVPLPPKTAFSARHSETGANYITKSTKDDIIVFYGDLAVGNTFSKVVDGETTELSFLYGKQKLKVIITQYDGRKNYNYLSVDLFR